MQGQTNVPADFQPARHRCGCPAQLAIQNLDAILSRHRKHDVRLPMNPFGDLTGPLSDRENVLPSLHTAQIELVNRVKILGGI